MHKIILFLFLFTFFTIAAQQAEKPPYPKSIIDIGPGFGAPYGIAGFQAVLGFKGNGLVLAKGYFDKVNTYYIGLQLSMDWFYVTVGRGVIETKTYGNSSTIGTTIVLGVKLDLDRFKRFYLQAGLGRTQSSFITPAGTLSSGGLAASMGLGYRISFSKSDHERYKQ